LLIFQGACAIDISFSANNGGGTVGMADSYAVDDSVGVSSKLSASFDSGVSMTDSKSLSGSGNANINQVMRGSGRGADYVINYALKTIGASRIAGSGGATLTPDSGWASRSASTTGGLPTSSELWVTQGRDMAGVGSYGELADVSTSQRVATGESVAASQGTRAEGSYARAYGYAEDAEGNFVYIYASVRDGTLDASQRAGTTGSAEGYQKTVIEGDLAYAFCEAYNPSKNYDAYVDNWIEGNAYLEFEGEAAVDDVEAMAHQRSYAEGGDIWPWMSTTNLDFRGFRMTGSYDVESWATAAAPYEELVMIIRSV
jgi:hypothetical protein